MTKNSNALADGYARRFSLREAKNSMFVYCTEALHMSESQAYLRIAAARASRVHPILLDMLTDGRLHLIGIAKLAPHLRDDNRDELLARATRKSKREIERIIAELAPSPDVPSVVRRLPTPARRLRPDAVESATLTLPTKPPPALVKPTAPARYKVQFTASAELEAKLTRLRALMRHQVTDGDLATLIDKAVTEKIARLEARQLARTKAPRKTLEQTDTSPSSRHIPAAIRRAVLSRDGEQCTFVSRNGERCRQAADREVHAGRYKIEAARS